jgi:purine-binding chemotaxis protein CheW
MNMNGIRAWCTFRIDGRLYGVAVDRVQEVLRSAAVTPVPLSPGAVRGLINLRGEIVTVVDLRRPLQLPAADPASPTLVVVQDGSSIMTLAVDAIEDVIWTREEDFEPCPDTLQAAARELIQGCCKLPNDLLLVLHLERALAAAAA